SCHRRNHSFCWREYSGNGANRGCSGLRRIALDSCFMETTQIEYLQSDMAGGCTLLNSPRNLVREFCEPLRIPYIVDAAWLDVTILHVKKRGLHFHEKAVSVRSDSGIHLWQNERKWFQYRFANQGLRGTAPENVRRQVMALLN